MTLNDDKYETSDLGLAASLAASNFTVTSVNKSNSRRVVFCFSKTPALLKAVDAYWAKDLLLPAMVLMESIKMLKARIYGE